MLLKERLQAPATPGLADARALGTAEGRVCGQRDVLVDPDAARVDLLLDLVRALLGEGARRSGTESSRARSGDARSGS